MTELQHAIVAAGDPLAKQAIEAMSGPRQELAGIRRRLRRACGPRAPKARLAALQLTCGIPYWGERTARVTMGLAVE